MTLKKQIADLTEKLELAKKHTYVTDFILITIFVEKKGI